MAKNTKQPRPVEPCCKCGDPVFGKDWMELDGLCFNCWKQMERNYEFLMDERRDNEKS